MSVLALGYIGVEARELDAWRAFGTDVLAMQVIENGVDALALRMDDRCQRVLVQRAERDGPAYFGFETAGAQALQALAGTLEAAGVTVTRASERELRLRRVADMAWCRDPAGNRIEIYHGQAAGAGPFTRAAPARRLSHRADGHGTHGPACAGHGRDERVLPRCSRLAADRLTWSSRTA